MRLYPPFPMFSRSLDKSYEIDGKLTPKGNVCLYISSRSPCEEKLQENVDDYGANFNGKVGGIN